jgi:hypothetical protein
LRHEPGDEGLVVAVAWIAAPLFAVFLAVCLPDGTEAHPPRLTKRRRFTSRPSLRYDHRCPVLATLWWGTMLASTGIAAICRRRGGPRARCRAGGPRDHDDWTTFTGFALVSKFDLRAGRPGGEALPLETQGRVCGMMVACP